MLIDHGLHFQFSIPVGKVNLPKHVWEDISKWGEEEKVEIRKHGSSTNSPTNQLYRHRQITSVSSLIS